MAVLFFACRQYNNNNINKCTKYDLSNMRLYFMIIFYLLALNYFITYTDGAKVVSVFFQHTDSFSFSDPPGSPLCPVHQLIGTSPKDESSSESEDEDDITESLADVEAFVRKLLQSIFKLEYFENIYYEENELKNYKAVVLNEEIKIIKITAL